MKKRLLICLALLAALLIANLVMIQAASEGDLSFVLNTEGTGYIVSDYTDTVSGTLSIPETHNGKPVVEIGREAFLNCTKLTSVTIPTSVKTIGWYAFSGCTGLTSINIPDSVTTIDWFAFSGCTGLTSVAIGNSVTCIDAAAFSGCSNLTSVTLGKNVTSIGWSAFKGCTSLTNISIHSRVTSIDRYAFYECNALSAITYCSTQENWNEITVLEGNQAWQDAEVEVIGSLSCDATITIAGKTLSYQDEIKMKFAYTITGTPTVKQVKVFSSREAAEARNDPVQIHDLFESGNTWQAYSNGIPARKMGDSVYVVGYIEFADGGYVYSDVLEYSPLIYAKNMLGKDTTKPATKDLCKALLHYGAAAQVYIDKKTDGLMNEGIDPVPFDESVLGESILSVQKDVYKNGMAYAGANISFDGAISYKFAFTLDEERASKDVYLEYSIGGGSVKEIKLEKNGTTYQCEIAGNPARTMGDEVVARPYYLDESGNRVYGLEIHYSGYEYARNKKDSDTDGAKLARAFAMYVHAAKVAIGN